MSVEPTAERTATLDHIPLDAAARAAEADLPTGSEKTALVRSMFDAIAPRYDVVNRLMTFGLDIRWRRQSVDALGLPAGSLVLDLACGTGDFLKILRREGLNPLGMDLSWGMLAANRTGAPLAQADVSALPVADASVDGMTCGYALRNFTDLQAACGELGRVVRPGGRISLLEVAEPEHVLLRIGHRTWFRHVVPVIGGILSDGAAYRYLPKSTAYLPPTAELRSMLHEAGFSSVNRRALSGGLSQLITATRMGRTGRP
ncbi:MAG TPA: ubiquinone/menaquinone biosynthesis methyltransferase [Acidimicrobiales bacterium]|jgi:demethylmenaquinone methyltransferase/2-methoxy-6-polyprenyl-1,4-benzoquinol methylase|nr:ubiquinone/menaquinone biosynthesis methyltransferase [Acidimicrobiales bacterium]